MSLQLVLPGQRISGPEGMMRGHGTYKVEKLPFAGRGIIPYLKEDAKFLDGTESDESSTSSIEEDIARKSLVACVSGRVQRVDTLVSVVPVSGRYRGQVGDLVVGKIIEVGHKIWKVDIGATRYAILALSSVHLPNDAQRIRTRQDALAMRELFKEGDIIVAEIQMSRPDGPPQLQTRSTRYGRLSQGRLVQVGAHLIQRLPAHFVTLENRNIDLALGNNGWIWIQRRIPEIWLEEAAENEGFNSINGFRGGFGRGLSSEAWKSLRDRHAKEPLSTTDISSVFRMAASAMALGHVGASITPITLDHLFSLSLKLFPTDPTPILFPHNATRLVHHLITQAKSYGKDLGYLQCILDYNASLSSVQSGARKKNLKQDNEQVHKQQLSSKDDLPATPTVDSGKKEQKVEEQSLFLDPAPLPGRIGKGRRSGSGGTFRPGEQHEEQQHNSSGNRSSEKKKKKNNNKKKHSGGSPFFSTASSS
eukprot:CAMPEP_0197315078 /NCGR_PEP_ID=MMETSP0891-20130614/36625_1 /TAXON_ID=44058 ORGANISM="Aureoumbra lagunensis, Strain CCMP1510" /NCGR_SAMPLE_ID=MMETSP0891 /ASSEMBLY_ACC=CAM_ASM_000534 /LENGTH=476 /DNA_ID=CAMNT_0042803851 /DNA_START=28 /DNA_END=1455 /DNA_ORIENTATION=-